ncbi:MAG: hypothetical protein RIC07_15660, partial [Coleofasciculus sp. E1-EBD-02]
MLAQVDPPDPHSAKIVNGSFNSQFSHIYLNRGVWGSCKTHAVPFDSAQGQRWDTQLPQVNLGDSTLPKLTVNST